MPEESTTPDLVELVRKQVEALDRGDLDGVMSSVAEDAVLDGRVESLEGRAAIRGFLPDWFRAFDELDFELEEVSHLGGGVVFAVVIQDGRLVGSPGRVRQREGWVYLCVGGSIQRLTTYADIDEARAAAERLAESTNPNLAERVSAFFEAANRRDIEARMSFLAREAVWDLSPMGMGTFEGRAAIRRFLEDWRSSFDEVWWTLGGCGPRQRSGVSRYAPGRTPG